MNGSLEHDWYYVGHYGQLGPLDHAQILELVSDGVIEPETFVWHQSLVNWCPARIIPSFAAKFASNPPTPPPFNRPGPSIQPQPHIPPFAPPVTLSGPEAYHQSQMGPGPFNQMSQPGYAPMPGYSPISAGSIQSYHPDSMAMMYAPVSDKSRLLGGILQLIIPGIGRMYLGYSAIGVLQFFLGICTGVLWLWSIIDGILILTGNLRIDGYGRRLTS